MLKLKFDSEKCARCKTISCLTKCQYIDLKDVERARSEWQKIIHGDYSLVLDVCATCYACEEYCPFGNHPFYLIVERQEEKDRLAAPRALIRQWINMCEPAGKYQVGRVGEKALSFCFIPRLQLLATGKLFEDIGSSWIYGAEFFCNAVYLHFSRMSVIKERLPQIVENIRNQGIKELICLHDECYATFTSLAPAYGIEIPFRVRHYFEFLYEKLTALKDRVRPLNIKAAYQRNCSTRLVPHIDRLVDDIFQLIGVKRLQREYDRDNALCCGALILQSKGYDAGTDVQKRNLDDMARYVAEYCVFNCPACWDPLAEKVAKRGIIPIHMIDLCKLAIGEKPALEV